MARIRFRRPAVNTYQLLLNLTNRHIHAQLVDKNAGRVLVAAHTNEPALRHKIAGPDAPPNTYVTSTVAAARQVGQHFAERACAKGITAVYWQRPGKYHGKIKAFIDAVREAGIETKRAPKPDMPPVPEINN